MAHQRTRPPRDCPHNGRHKHGTAVAYRTDQCGCDPCVAADRAATKRRRHGARTGRPAMVPAAPVATHVRSLQAAGMGTRRIAEQAGVAVTTVSWLVWPRTDTGRTTRRLQAAHAAAILAVQPTVSRGQCVDPTGTRRRIQALVARGWCLSEIGRQLGYTGHTAQVRVWQILHTTIQARTASRVAELYEHLWDQPPPADTRWQKGAITGALRLAARNGWAPPMAWDDDTIDNPHAQPATGLEPNGELDDIAVLRIIAGQLRPASLMLPETLEAIRQLAAMGMTDREIGARIRWAHSAVCQARRRAGIPAGSKWTGEQAA